MTALRSDRLLMALALLLVLGLLYRLWPIVAGMPALANFYMTEDGYLMLTVSRNMAIGNGMSVSDGTIATNGVQPLIAFLFAIPYMITGGDKVTSLVGVHIIAAAAAFLAIFPIRAFAARVLAPRDPGPVWPWAVAAVWLLGPVLPRHSMNGLETGLYTLVSITTLVVFARVLDRDAGLGPRLLLGALCGLSVLARNDAVFLVAAIFAVWAVWELIVPRRGFVAMIIRLVPPGLLSIAVAAPWLLNNLFRFGSIVPISGTAQSMGAELGGNLSLLPIVLFENAFPMLPVPTGLNENTVIITLALVGLCVVTLGLLWYVFRTCPPVVRALVVAYLLFAIALAGYYGVFFGARHFLSRYVAPTAPLFIVAALVTCFELGRLLRLRSWLATAYIAVGLALAIGISAYKTLPGSTLQGHEQVVAWGDANVPDEAWAAAVQTGTLGYWHDRTYNLDGKVNPEALQAIRTDGHVLDYVTASEIDYIVDWWGVGAWVEFPHAQGPGKFAETFERIVHDRAANLAVMVRR